MTKNDLISRAEDLAPFFNTSSIAIIGASNDKNKPGGAVLVNLQNGFKGKIFPINPTHKEINGLTCYPNILKVQESIDVVIITVVASQVFNAVKECIAKGIKHIIIFSSGFSEAGGEGIKLQENLKKLANEYNLRICGPNCMGIINFHTSMKASFTFGGIYTDIFPGASKTVGFITQSGGFGVSVLTMAMNQGIGFSHYISTGNEMESDFSDFLAFLANNPETRVIAGYMEGVRDGRKLAIAADIAIEAKKPIVIFKTARYKASAKAALSHTGALAGHDLVYSSFFRQKGIIRPDSIEEMIATLSILETKKLPQGKRAAIFASSGGHCVVLADKCVEAGLEVAMLSENTRNRLAKLLPSFAAVDNPIDFTGQDLLKSDLLKSCAGIVAEDPGVDMLIFSYWAVDTVQDFVLNQMIQISTSLSKPVIAVVMGTGGTAHKHVNYLYKRGIPTIMGLDCAMKAISNIVNYTLKVNDQKINTCIPISLTAKEKVKKILSEFKPGTSLSEAQAKEILSIYGIPVAVEKRASRAEEAIAAAEEIGYPVVLKVDSPDIIHKTEVKGVKLNLNTAEEVKKAFEEIITNARRCRPEADIKGVLVQQMLKTGTEVIVGISTDPVFGHTVMFGLGGILVEAIGDVSLRIVPVSEDDAWEMLYEIKGRHILDSLRGKPAVDKKAIIDIILKVSQMAVDFPQIAELDINPLIVFEEGKGSCAADALIVLK